MNVQFNIPLLFVVVLCALDVFSCFQNYECKVQSHNSSKYEDVNFKRILDKLISLFIFPLFLI